MSFPPVHSPTRKDGRVTARSHSSPHGGTKHAADSSSTASAAAPVPRAAAVPTASSGAVGMSFRARGGAAARARAARRAAEAAAAADAQQQLHEPWRQISLPLFLPVAPVPQQPMQHALFPPPPLLAWTPMIPAALQHLRTAPVAAPEHTTQLPHIAAQYASTDASNAPAASAAARVPPFVPHTARSETVHTRAETATAKQPLSARSSPAHPTRVVPRPFAATTPAVSAAAAAPVAVTVLRAPPVTAAARTAYAPRSSPPRGTSTPADSSRTTSPRPSPHQAQRLLSQEFIESLRGGLLHGIMANMDDGPEDSVKDEVEQNKHSSESAALERGRLSALAPAPLELVIPEPALPAIASPTAVLSPSNSSRSMPTGMRTPSLASPVAYRRGGGGGGTARSFGGDSSAGSSRSGGFLDHIDDLVDASSEEDEDSSGNKVDAAAVEAPPGDWDALPSSARMDLATSMVLSMCGAVASSATSSTAAANGPASALAARRGGLWADSRMLCFGLTAIEAESALRAFEAEDCTVSMALIESTPAHTVLLHSVPVIPAPSALPGAAAARIAASQRREDFLSLLCALSPGTYASPDELACILDGQTVFASSLTTDRETTRALVKPFPVLKPGTGRAVTRAQAAEIVERLRDRGVQASVALRSDDVSALAAAAAPAPMSPSGSEPCASPRAVAAAAFSVHLRLSHSNSSFGPTDSLLQLVRSWLPAVPAVEYLLTSVEEMRAPHPPAEPAVEPEPEVPALSPEEEIALEVERIKRWAASANVRVQFGSAEEEERQRALAEAQAAGQAAALALAADRAAEADRVAAAAQESATAAAQAAEVAVASHASQAAQLAAQVASLQSMLEEKLRVEASSEAERTALRQRVRDAEQSQARLVKEHLELQEQSEKQRLAAEEAATKAIAAAAAAASASAYAAAASSSSSSSAASSSSSSSAAPALSKAAQLRLDRELAESLHRSLNIDSPSARLASSTAHRNMEKQRGLHAIESGLTTAAGKGGKSKRSSAATSSSADSLGNVSFDAKSASGAPTFADTPARAAEQAAAFTARLAADRARAAAQRIQERAPTEGQRMKDRELFTLNHAEMRQLMHQLKSELQTEAATPLSLEQRRALQQLQSSLKTGAADEKQGTDFASLPLAEQKRLQASTQWHAAHLPHMLEGVRRASMVPATHDERLEAERALAAVARNAEEGTNSEGGTRSTSSKSAGAAASSVPAEEKSTALASQLVAYSAATASGYDKLTGVPLEDLRGMSARERLARAEQRVDEAEWDDVYRRFLQPKGYTATGGNSSGHGSSGAGGEEKSRRTKSKMRKSHGSSSAAHSHQQQAQGVTSTLRVAQGTDLYGAEESTMVAAGGGGGEDDGNGSGAEKEERASGDVLSPSSSPRRHRKSGGLSRKKSRAHKTKGDDGGVSPLSSMRASGEGVDASPSSSASSSSSSAAAGAKSDSQLYFVDLSVSAVGLESPFLLVDPDPYLEVLRCRQYIWEKILASEICPRTRDANWRPMLASVDALCNMQLDRQILFQVWSHNRMASGRTLLGEIKLSLAQIQENIGSKFKLTLPSGNKVALGGRGGGGAGANQAAAAGLEPEKNCGFLKFHHAELCVNSTKPTLHFSNLHSKASALFAAAQAHAAQPSKGLSSSSALVPSSSSTSVLHSSCLVRLQFACEGLPQLGRFALFREDPDPYLELFRLGADGRWDLSLHQGAAASGSGGSGGGCLFRTEPASQTTRPKYVALVLALHELVLGGDVSRPVRVRVRHRSETLGWCDLSLRDMVRAVGKKVRLNAPAESKENAAHAVTAPAADGSTATQRAQLGTLASAMAKPAAATADPRRGSMPSTPSGGASSVSASSSPPPAGFLVIRHASVFSHLAQLPTLCAAAGVTRRPVRGVSELPLRQLILQQEAQLRADRGEDNASTTAAASPVPTLGSRRESDMDESNGGSDPSSLPPAGSAAAAAASSESAEDVVCSLPSIPSKVSRNVYRGLHHIRAQSAGKFFSSFLPVASSLLEARQRAFLMAAHPRLGEESAAGKHFLKSEIFDPHLVSLIFTFLS